MSIHAHLVNGCGLLLALAAAAAAQIEIHDHAQDPTPMGEDLNGIAIHPTDGARLAVGDGPTIILSRDAGAEWEARDSFATANFSAEIFDVAASPVDFGGQPAGVPVLRQVAGVKGQGAESADLGSTDNVLPSVSNQTEKG